MTGRTGNHLLLYGKIGKEVTAANTGDGCRQYRRRLQVSEFVQMPRACPEVRHSTPYGAPRPAVTREVRTYRARIRSPVFYFGLPAISGDSRQFRVISARSRQCRVIQNDLGWFHHDNHSVNNCSTLHSNRPHGPRRRWGCNYQSWPAGCSLPPLTPRWESRPY